MVGRVDPYETLGVSRDVTERRLRSRFRALVLELHPDRRPGDPNAAARLLAVVDAYEQVMDGLRGRPARSRRTRVTPASRRPGPAARDRFRFVCPCCDESYAFPDLCSRCDVELTDSFGPPRPRAPTAPADPRVAALIAELERRGDPAESRVGAVAPEIMAAVVFGAAVVAYSIFPPIGVMFAAYVLFVLAVRSLDQHRALPLLG